MGYNRYTAPPLEERFWEKVYLPPCEEDCWLWTAHRARGYGRFWLDGRLVPAHRWAYEQEVGPIPKGLQLDHLCRNRACVNLGHLEPVTNRENVLRGNGLTAQQARRTHCPQGHSYDVANTYTDPTGGRRCRECERLRDRRRDHRKVY